VYGLGRKVMGLGTVKLGAVDSGGMIWVVEWNGVEWNDVEWCGVEWSEV
jgi:hypothetical protein